MMQYVPQIIKQEYDLIVIVLTILCIVIIMIFDDMFNDIENRQRLMIVLASTAVIALIVRIYRVGFDLGQIIPFARYYNGGSSYSAYPDHPFYVTGSGEYGDVKHVSDNTLPIF